MPTKSKKQMIKETRVEYQRLTRAYHKIGDLAAGKREGSQVKKDYRAVQRERTRVGRRLGKLTGVHRGR